MRIKRKSNWRNFAKIDISEWEELMETRKDAFDYYYSMMFSLNSIGSAAQDLRDQITPLSDILRLPESNLDVQQKLEEQREVIEVILERLQGLQKGIKLFYEELINSLE